MYVRVRVNCKNDRLLRPRAQEGLQRVPIMLQVYYLFQRPVFTAFFTQVAVSCMAFPGLPWLRQAVGPARGWLWQLSRLAQERGHVGAFKRMVEAEMAPVRGEVEVVVIDDE